MNIKSNFLKVILFFIFKKDVVVRFYDVFNP
jgi:hypothetical protein